MQKNYCYHKSSLLLISVHKLVYSTCSREPNNETLKVMHPFKCLSLQPKGKLY